MTNFTTSFQTIAAEAPQAKDITFEDVQKALNTISTGCIKGLFFMAAASAILLVSLAIGAALTWEAGKAARRYWYERNCSQRILSALIMYSVHALAWSLSNAPIAKAAIAQNLNQSINAYQPAARFIRAHLSTAPARINRGLEIAFQLA